VKWMRIRHTIFKRHGANNIPTNSTNVNPTDLDPRLAFAGGGTVEEVDEILVGHTSKTAPNARVVCDFDETVLSDVPIVEVGRVPANVDTRFGTRSLTSEATRGFVDVHHFAHRPAEALDGWEGDLEVGLFGRCGPM